MGKKQAELAGMPEMDSVSKKALEIVEVDDQIKALQVKKKMMVADLVSLSASTGREHVELERATVEIEHVEAETRVKITRKKIKSEADENRALD